jgi:hypothetical protein
MLAVFAQQLSGTYAVFQQQYLVVAANTRGLFSEQFMGPFAIFRDQYTIPTTIPVKNWGVFSEQQNGALAVFRDQQWISEPEIPVPGPTKVSIRMLSSGKVRLINGRIQLSRTNYV